ncbi:hypothetical protein ACWCPF_29345 [Streptomyces sp. NPDC001858]
MPSRHLFKFRRFATRYGRSSWQLEEELRSRVAEMRVIVTTSRDPEGDSEAQERIRSTAIKELDKADKALNHRNNNGNRNRDVPGTNMAVAQAHLDSAHSLMLRLAPMEVMLALLPGLVSIVREHLCITDLRRVQVEEIEQSVAMGGERLSVTQRELIIDAVGVARQALLRETLRVRSFVVIVYGVFVVLTLTAITVAALAAAFPAVVPLCFGPMDDVGIVCPTGDEPHHASLPPINLDTLYGKVAMSRDYLVVELVGMGAAAVAAAATLRRIRGTSTPYNVPVALALLKLPTGALTAVLGILLMRGAFVPGLSSLDSSAQIIGWAIIFGYAQQIFTRLVDQQGQAVLDAVGGPTTPHASSVNNPAETIH